MRPKPTDAYRHITEGPDNSPPHIKGALSNTQCSIPVGNHAMMLGAWQGVFLFEHRRTPPDREIVLHLIGL